MAERLDSYVSANRRQQTIGGVGRGWRPPSAQEIMREACDWCGAGPGDPCMIPSGRVFKAFHAKRMHRARYIPPEARPL